HHQALPEGILGHELIHALHNSEGTNRVREPDPKDTGGDQEESWAMGINDHTGEEISENNLLKDLGADYRRKDHSYDVNSVPPGSGATGRDGGSAEDR